MLILCLCLRYLWIRFLFVVKTFLDNISHSTWNRNWVKLRNQRTEYPNSTLPLSTLRHRTKVKAFCFFLTSPGRLVTRKRRFKLCVPTYLFRLIDCIYHLLHICSSGHFYAFYVILLLRVRCYEGQSRNFLTTFTTNLYHFFNFFIISCFLHYIMSFPFQDFLFLFVVDTHQTKQEADVEPSPSSQSL